MSDPTPPNDDDTPHGAATDGPLSLAGRTPGPRGLAPKVGLAALGVLVLFLLTAAAWLASHCSPKAPGQRAPATVESHP